MTPDQLKSLRALCESTANQTGPTVFGSVAWYRGRAIELAQAVPALIEEVESLRAQLSAMTAARDGLYAVAHAALGARHGCTDDGITRLRTEIEELRKVGQ